MRLHVNGDNSGPISNDKLLLKYGFALGLNEEPTGYCLDEVTFVLSLPQDTFKLRLVEATTNLAIKHGAVTISATYVREVPNVFSLLRLVAAGGEDLETIKTKKLKSAFDVKFVSASNEVTMFFLVFTYTCNGCARLEAKYEYSP